MRIGERAFLVIGLTIVGIFMITGIIGISLTTGILNYNVDYLTSKETTVDEFSKLEIQGNLPIEYSYGDESKITVISTATIEDLQLLVDVRDESLFITQQYSLFRNIFTNNSDRIEKIQITSPQLNTVKIFSNGSFNSNNLTGESMDVEVIGSGSITLQDVDFDRMRTLISGSGDIILSGTVDSINSEIFGSGNLDAINLQAKESEIEISGSGDIDISVSDLLDITINGSGDVSYRGEPNLNQQINGSGDVNKI